MTTHVDIRWMIRRDMPEVMMIEAQSFEQRWREEDFLKPLRRRNVIGKVAERGERVVGFMLYELHAKRLHVLRLAVDPPYRREGVGTALLHKLVGKLTPERRSILTAQVRESNLDAQLFLRANGFRAVGVQRRHYGDTSEDAYNFAYRLQGSQRALAAA